MSIDFYKEEGPLGYLANYSNHGFIVENTYYKTAEHFYQANKFDDPKIREKVINADTPKEASNIGRDRNNIRRKDFKDIKLDVMQEGLYQKFKQNKDIRSKLIETRNEPIREMTTKESYWGIGPNLDGENHIGNILMNVRNRVKCELLGELLNKCKNKKVYVIGHHKPDVDSVFSSLLLTKILKELGFDATFAVRDENFVDKEFIKDYLKEDYEVVDDYSNKNFILVDHNNLDQIPKENVLGSIDHHRITNEVEDLIEIEYASTGLLIYDLFKDLYQFTEEDKKLIALTVLSDTEFLTSSRFSEEDQKLYKELDVKLDSKELKKKYLKTTPFNLEISDNFLRDYKEYNYNGFHINRSLIKSYEDDRKKHFQEYQDHMKKNSINLMIWCDYETLETYICYNDLNLKFPYFTTSTYLVLDYLKEKEYLKK